MKENSVTRLQEYFVKLREFCKELECMNAPHELTPGKDGDYPKLAYWYLRAEPVLDFIANDRERNAFAQIFPEKFWDCVKLPDPNDFKQRRDRARLRLKELLEQENERIELEKTKANAFPGVFDRVMDRLIKIFALVKGGIESSLLMKGVVGAIFLVFSTEVVLVCGKESTEKPSITLPGFDIAQCHPRTLILAEPINEASLLGLVTAARPNIMECLVDPKAHVSPALTRVMVETIVERLSGVHVVSGVNLSQEGRQCVQRALDEYAGVDLLSSNSGASSRLEFEYEQSTDASDFPRGNGGMDFAASVRLAQSQWCECYESFSSIVPPQVKITAHINDGQSPRIDEPIVDPGAQSLAHCLRAKVMSMHPMPGAGAFDVSLEFVHFNSLATSTEKLPPGVGYTQKWLAVHNRTVDVDLALSPYVNAKAEYKVVANSLSKSGLTIETPRLLLEYIAKRALVLESIPKPEEALEAKLQDLEELLVGAQGFGVNNYQTHRWTREEAKIKKTIRETQDSLEELRRDRDELQSKIF